MARTKCEYNWKNSGRQVFYDGVSHETLVPMFPVQFYDDFIGADIVIPSSTGVESGCKWAKKIVGAAPPTVAGGADAINGVVACVLTTDSQKQDAALYMADQREFSLGQGLIFEARINLATLPTALAEIHIGLYGDWADGGSAYRVEFLADGSGELLCVTDDNVTEISATSGITLTNTDWAVLRIDCTDKAAIKFFINGVQVAVATTFNYTATGANLKVQPFVGGYKASGAGVGTVNVDYVKVFQNRE